MRLNCFIRQISFLFLIGLSFSCGNNSENQESALIGSWNVDSTLKVGLIHAVIKVGYPESVPPYYIDPNFNLTINGENHFNITSYGDKTITGDYTFINDTLKLNKAGCGFFIANVVKQLLDTMIMTIENTRFVEMENDSFNLWSAENIVVRLVRQKK